MRKYLLLPLLLALVISCNKDDVITQENENPLIELDSETGVYVVKVGKEVKVNPTYSNVDFAVYSWKYNGRIISDSPSLTYTFNQSGSYYVTIRVDTPKGSSEEEIRMEVNELAPPVISLVVPTGGLNVLAGREHKITPDIQNAEGAIFRWTLNGKEVGTTAEYTFNEQELGSYKLVLYAKNEDGDTSKEVVVNVVDKLSADATIVAPSFYTENLVKTVALGRTLYLRPYVNISSVANYQWSLDGEPISGANSLMYAYTPEAKGEHTLTFALSYGNSAAQKRITRNISVTGTDKISLDIPVACIDASEKRPYTEGCSLNSNKVYEFIPAPGQFVNETNTAGYTGTESTQEAAIAYAENRLATTSYVSLGGWGGYIVVGFDHSIENKGGYDFSIIGNAFEGSSEPGIVWVMQDVNGNQLPDDEWYELKGSEYGKNGILVMGDVAVTPVPDAEQLAQIAVCTARTAQAVAGLDPKVAMLSFSTKGSAKHEEVDKVVEALKIAKEMAPDIAIDGELQADAALVPEVGASKAPGSSIAGHANVLVVPSLEVGNISYKLVQRLGHADAVGPILQGIARPVNDLSRGCSIEDVYRMIAITANQAIAAKKNAE